MMEILMEPKVRHKKNKTANTRTITIPAHIARDSRYPFKNNDELSMWIDTKNAVILITKTSLEAIKVDYIIKNIDDIMNKNIANNKENPSEVTKGENTSYEHWKYSSGLPSYFKRAQEEKKSKDKNNLL